MIVFILGILITLVIIGYACIVWVALFIQAIFVWLLGGGWVQSLRSLYARSISKRVSNETNVGPRG